MKALNMKSTVIKFFTTIGISCLLLIFMGQDDCQKNEMYKQMFDAMRHRLPIPSPGKEKLYITNLTFMDALTQSKLANTEIGELINREVLKWLKRLQEFDHRVVINELGHIIPDTDENINRLVNITFDPNLTKTQKINRIINDMMIPNGVDMIVIGQYIDDAKSSLISLRPLIIFREGKKIITKNLQFIKEELFCIDSKSQKTINLQFKKSELFCQDHIKKGKILCDGAYNQIAYAVQELILQCELEDRSIEILPLMVPLTQSPMANKEDSELIDKAIIDGVYDAKSKSKKIAFILDINAPNHTIPNTDTNINNLINIIFIF